MKKFFVFIIIGSIFSFSQLYSQKPNKNMNLLANLNSHSPAGLYSAVWGYSAPDGREYAILGCYDGTSFVDITDADNIHEVDFLPSTNPSSGNNIWREMKTYSHYAYIVSEVSNSGIQIVDLQYLPDSVRYVKKFIPTNHIQTHSISQSGPFLYLNGCTGNNFGQGVTVLDLTFDPVTPIKRGGYNADYIHDCRVVDTLIFAANIYTSKVSILSARNKNLLKFVSSFTNLPNSGPHNTAITPDMKHLLVTDEIGSSPMRLKIWNIEDLSNITYVTNWQPTGITNSIVHNVEVYGNYALVAHYTAGIRLVDISNPSVPAEVAWYDTYPSNDTNSYNGCWGGYMFPSGKIIASDRQTGLYVLKTNFNIKVIMEGFYDQSTNAMRMDDTVRAYLRNAKSPYNITDSSKAVIDSVSFTGNFKFNVAPAGTYYITVKHRNSIETWSKVGGEVYDPMKLGSFDFTFDQSQAYQNNMSSLNSSPTKFAIFSGDPNQDGVIDVQDVGIVDNGASSFLTGYALADLNGDNVVDIQDLLIAENNSFNFVTKATP